MSKTEAVQEMYSELKVVIDDIDEKLDSLDDSGTAGKRKMANELVESTSNMWTPVVSQLTDKLSDLDANELVGVYRGIAGELKKAFEEQVNKTLEAMVEQAPKSEPLITQDEAVELSAQRSDVYKHIKQVVELAEVMYGLELTMPKIRRGSKGKRGPRVTTLMTWSIDGTELEDAKYKEVAIAAGFDGSAELTKYLKDQEIDTKAPEGNEIRVNLPDGRELYGFIPEDEDEEESEED